MLSSEVTLRWKLGATSMTTWYWFSWVKMVETWRWPKASSSVSSMFCGVMPSRDAVSRSMTSSACRPSSCWSLATSVSTGSFLNCVDQLVGGRGELVGARVFNRVLVLRAGDAVFYGEVLQRLQEGLDAVDLVDAWAADAG